MQLAGTFALLRDHNPSNSSRPKRVLASPSGGLQNEPPPALYGAYSGGVVYFIVRPARLNRPFGPQLNSTFSARGISILSGAKRVEVFRVLPEQSSRPNGDEIGGYPITAAGKEQGQDFAKRLSAVLLGSGVTQNRKKCGLQPGIAFRIWKDNEAVEVLICFNCDVLWPYVVGEPSDKPFSQWQDFDPVRADLVTLAKEAFPDDKEIKSLWKWR